MKTLKDKVAVVTGAGRGIGRAAALTFSEAGCDVAVVDIREDSAVAVREEIESRGGRASAYSVDVSDRLSMQSFAKQVTEDKGRVDILVNNAGVGVGGELKDMDLDDWEWLVGVNYWGVVYGIHFFMPQMIERRSGHIVNVASANGLFSMPFEGVYSSTKFAVVGLSETLRAEVARYGVGVTTVCPGMTNTPIMKEARMKYGSRKSREFLDKFQELMAARGADPAVPGRAIVEGIVKNKAVVRVPFHVKAGDWIHRFAPWLYRFVIAEVSKRQG